MESEIRDKVCHAFSERRCDLYAFCIFKPYISIYNYFVISFVYAFSKTLQNGLEGKGDKSPC